MSTSTCPSIAIIKLAVFRHRGVLLAYIDRQIPAKLSRTIDATDILQDVCIDALATDGTWMNGADETAVLRGLKTIARHKIVDTLRWHEAAKRGSGNVAGMAELANRSAEMLIEQMTLYERTPSASAMSHEAHELVKRTIEELGAEQAMALRLRYGSGLSLKEVGEQMSRTQDAASELCRRALRELRLRLTPAV